MSVSLIMMGAGNSTRFGLHVKKQWLRIGAKPLWLYVTEKLALEYDFEKVIVVGTPSEQKYMEKFSNFVTCKGGDTREQSLINALEHVKSEYVLVSDVARACVDGALLKSIFEKKGLADSVIPVLDVADTVYYKAESIEREFLKRVQTPQLSRVEVLKRALHVKGNFTDESSAIKHLGGSVVQVCGDEKAMKLTTLQDFHHLKCLEKPSTETFVGNGFDVHAFGEKRPLILGGVKVHETMGVKAHSDGDVLVHSLIDALLGACGGGDIGELFPDSDPLYAGANSMSLLEKVVCFVEGVGFEVVNCDMTIIAQKPKISSFKREMERVVAQALHVEPFRVNAKATTTEKLGFTGRGEGIAAMSVVSLKFFDWTKI